MVDFVDALGQIVHLFEELQDVLVPLVGAYATQWVVNQAIVRLGLASAVTAEEVALDGDASAAAAAEQGGSRLLSMGSGGLFGAGGGFLSRILGGGEAGGIGAGEGVGAGLIGGEEAASVAAPEIGIPLLIGTAIAAAMLSSGHGGPTGTMVTPLLHGPGWMSNLATAASPLTPLSHPQHSTNLFSDAWHWYQGLNLDSVFSPPNPSPVPVSTAGSYDLGRITASSGTNLNELRMDSQRRKAAMAELATAQMKEAVDWTGIQSAYQAGNVSFGQLLNEAKIATTSAEAAFHNRPTTATYEQLQTVLQQQNQYLAVPGRIATSARKLTLHLPTHWPWAGAFEDMLAKLRSVSMVT